MSSLLLVLYTYVGGEFRLCPEATTKTIPRAVHAKSQTAREHLKGASARAVPDCNAGRTKSVLAVLPAKLRTHARPSATFPGRAGAGKVRCQLDSVTALNPKWHDGKQVQTSGETKRGKQLPSNLETPQRRPPPSYDAPLPRCVMTFQ